MIWNLNVFSVLFIWRNRHSYFMNYIWSTGEGDRDGRKLWDIITMKHNVYDSNEYFRFVSALYFEPLNSCLLTSLSLRYPFCFGRSCSFVILSVFGSVALVDPELSFDSYHTTKSYLFHTTFFIPLDCLLLIVLYCTFHRKRCLTNRINKQAISCYCRSLGMAWISLVEISY